SRSCFLNREQTRSYASHARPLAVTGTRQTGHCFASSQPNGNFLSLPSQRFQVSLILFYSFKVLTYKINFSSFIHITCSLSVSHSYLALGEVYLQIRAAVPNNSTLQATPSVSPMQYGAFTLHGGPFQDTCASESWS